MRKPKKISLLRYLFLLFLLLAMQTHSFSQAALNWAFIPTSTSLFQNQITITATDQSGNIIEVGKLTGHADMDPGTGPNDTSYTRFIYNHYLSKTSVSGQLLWIYYFEDNSQLSTFEFKGLKITPTDEIIVVGNFTGKVDFDLRSPGVDTLRSHHTSFPDYIFSKIRCFRESPVGYKWGKYNFRNKCPSTLLITKFNHLAFFKSIRNYRC